jgi:hypothetical protein
MAVVSPMLREVLGYRELLMAGRGTQAWEG